MKRSELVDLLNQLPDLEIVVDSYEYGYTDFNKKKVGVIPILRNVVSDRWYAGPHMEADSSLIKDDHGKIKEEVILLSRGAILTEEDKIEIRRKARERKQQRLRDKV